MFGLRDIACSGFTAIWPLTQRAFRPSAEGRVTFPLLAHARAGARANGGAGPKGGGQDARSKRKVTQRKWPLGAPVAPCWIQALEASVFGIERSIRHAVRLPAQRAMAVRSSALREIQERTAEEAGLLGNLRLYTAGSSKRFATRRGQEGLKRGGFAVNFTSPSPRRGEGWGEGPILPRTLLRNPRNT